MIKFKWLLDKILWQRVLLLSIGGGIAREILTGYVDYNNKVVEYMQSMSYRQARDTYSRMKSNQHLFSLHTAESPAEYQDAASTERIANE